MDNQWTISESIALLLSIVLALQIDLPSSNKQGNESVMVYVIIREHNRPMVQTQESYTCNNQVKVNKMKELAK